ncbi:MAG: NADH:flavin oxidoreductase/NADH oxidase [Pseudomonadota bacterium]
MASRLFSPIDLRGLTLPNRVAVSPMCQYSAEEGRANSWHQAHLTQLSLSGAGLLILEATAVEARGRITPGCLGLYDQACEAALAPIIAACRAHGGAKMGIQLAHAGRKASADVPWEGGQPLTEAQGAWPVVGPSMIPFDEGWPMPETASLEEIAAIKQAFVETTERALRLDFDLIELHGAHGYLISSFLSPLSNKRSDAYGGSLNKRIRLPLEIFEAMRAVWPSDRPLGYRLQGHDWVEGGWDLEGAVTLAGALKEAGCDYVVVSSGGNAAHQKIETGPGYQVPFAKEVRAKTGLPTMAVGMITGAQQAETLVREETVDMVALARAFLADPRWALRAAAQLDAKPPFCAPQYERALHQMGYPHGTKRS